MNIRNYSQKSLLHDGSQILIRAIRPNDKQQLLDGFRHLTDRSIYFRFFSDKHELSEEELRYFTEVDFNHHVAIVAVSQIEDKEIDIAVGRYIELKDKGAERAAEVAFTVEDEYQHIGIGSLLFKHLVLIAQDQSISRLVAEVLLENKGMLAIFKQSGFKLETTISYGVAHIEFNITDQGGNKHFKAQGSSSKV